MAARQDIEPIFEKALKIIDDREDMYGDSWKASGKEVCIPEVFRKATYIRVQWERNKYTSEKFQEDLLDLMNWAAFALWHVEKETTDAKEKIQ